MQGADRSIVNDLLRQFVTRLRERDLAGALQLFSDDPVLFGSEAEETAHGVPELVAFFGRLFERPQTYGWTWEEPTVRKAGSVNLVRRAGDRRGAQRRRERAFFALPTERSA